MHSEEMLLPIHTTHPLSLLPEGPRTIIENTMKDRTALFGIDEHTLMQTLRKIKAVPNPTDHRLRLAFWNEYNLACEEGRQINPPSLYSGVCSSQVYYDNYLRSPERVAWLLCPPAKYEKILDESLAYGLEQLREILALPLMDEKGKINVSLASLKARIWTQLDERKHGTAVQRSLSISVGGRTDAALDNKTQEAILGTSMEEIQRRLKLLDKRDRMKVTEIIEDKTVPGLRAQEDRAALEIPVESITPIEVAVEYEGV